MSPTPHSGLRLGSSVSEPQRLAELQRLLPLWPAELADTSRNGRLRLVAKLEYALKAERRRGRAGHWTYDLARHAALLRAWRRERAAPRYATRPENRNGAGRG
ncbi:hypothetical protein [Hyphomicrobium sp.]|uniref:hypothetical protein n=1 Tax=Hyphomicrobium sp. TaxID=82 RepID=UPI002E2F953B|nr:hypothetical protein [Hyphomicrobium sp.]HEX2843339.1 hypothetical protein [Hyphomicrobium sp.]